MARATFHLPAAKRIIGMKGNKGNTSKTWNPIYERTARGGASQPAPGGRQPRMMLRWPGPPCYGREIFTVSRVPFDTLRFAHECRQHGFAIEVMQGKPLGGYHGHERPLKG